MKLFLLTVVAMLALGERPARAAVPAPERLVLKSSLGAAAPAGAPSLLASKLRFQAAELFDAGGGADVKEYIAIALAIVPSFGLGHFFYGDINSGIMFLVIQGALVLAGPVLFAIIGAVVPSFWPVVSLISALSGLVFLAIYVWQIYDILVKTHVLGALRAGRAAIEPANPNLLALRF